MGLLTIALSSSVYAGTMGPIQTATVSPFVGIEGGYTWSQLNGFDFNVVDTLRIRTNDSEKGWSGRISTGLIYPLNDTFSTTGEIGWGYYGKTDFSGVLSVPGLPTVNLNGVDIKSSQNGFDVLAGVMYTQPSYDLFFKAGALIQNSRLNVRINESLLDSDLIGIISNKSSQTEALPLIKLGGAYHINEQLSVTASWMHAFGSEQKYNVSLLQSVTAPAFNANINTMNPTIDSILVGLQYKFA